MSVYQNKFPPKSLSPGDSEYLFGVVGNAALSGTGTPGLSRSNTGTVTATTGAAHNFVIGQRVRIVGSVSVLYPSGDNAAIYGFDGEYTILTVPSTTTFTYYDPNKPVDTGGGGVAQSVQAETPTPGATTGQGAQVSLPLEQMGVSPLVSAEVWFTAAPGAAYEVDIQESDSDVDTGYMLPSPALAKTAATVNNTNNPVDTNNHTRSGNIPIGGRFTRATLISRTNAVGVVVKLTRIE